MMLRLHAVPCRSRAPAAAAATFLLSVLWGGGGGGAAPAAEPEQAAAAVAAQAAADPVDFGREIQPILARRCYKCHGPDKAEAGLRLNREESAFAELDSGARAVVPGKPGESALLERITETDEFIRMPPEEEPLSAAEIELFRRWIAGGAGWEQHWAFQPAKAPPVPAVAATDWAANPVDVFIQKRLAAAGLSPSAPADRVALIRRATYDLTGLPPAPAEVEEFAADDSPDAWHKLIDRLLASPAYGEKWGRHWLDLVRYAETNSFERDAAKPNVWRYRDYVIRSFNADKPYDQFIREQLAGDELDEVTRESIIATGYYRLGLWDDEPVDPVQAYYDELDDIVRTTGDVFLGLTIGCARCHDHKIDPVPQADYYKMLAFFHDLQSYGTRGDQRSNNQTDISTPEVAAAHERIERELRRAGRERRQLEETVIDRMPGVDQRKTETNEREAVLAEKLEQYATAEEFARHTELSSRIAALEQEQAALPPRELALSVNRSRREPPTTYILLRGGAHAHGDPVEPGFPTLFATPDPVIPAPPEDAESAGRRRVLADWIASPDNRLTARVMANRLWQFHFGRGIVRSPNDFGHQGDRPTHPELLDWLARELVGQESGIRDQESGQAGANVEHSTVNVEHRTDTGNGQRTTDSDDPSPRAPAPQHSPQSWSLKRLHRLIMTSSAYRMSSRADADALERDPTNDLLWRFDMRRLSAEEIRDSIHAVSGKLNRGMYGPSIYPELSPEVFHGQSRPGEGWHTSPPVEAARRSVYIHVKRSLIPPMLSNFDFADPDSSCAARFMTTQPAQALGMINGGFVHKQAQAFAERLRREAGDDREDQIRLALRLALSRAPREADVGHGLELIESLQSEHGLTADQALDYYCLVVLNLNEFVYLD